MKALHDIWLGTRFIGNINGGVYRVVNISKGRSSLLAVVMDEQTKKRYHIGMEALKRCDITILKD